MNYNFHTHTYRCRHASGTEEEYVLRAIEGGIRYMGFSDHAPLQFSDGFESTFRVPVEQVQDYFDTIGALRDKYRDQIDIRIGFEMEYYPTMFEDMLRFVKDCGAEYLILGEHFCIPEHPGPVVHNQFDHSDPESLENYVNTVIDAMKTGVFTYIAHPDLFRFSGDEVLYDQHMRRLCRAAITYNTPLEINFLGIRETRYYPHDEFWVIAGQEKAPVTFGCDAHDVPSAYDGESYQKALAMVKKFDLNYIGKPELILLQNL